MIATVNLMINRVRHMTERELALSLFTARERQVWKQIAIGKQNREIAEGLNLSIKTVEKFRQALYDKSEARNVADLTRMAIRYGIISVEVVS